MMHDHVVPIKDRRSLHGPYDPELVAQLRSLWHRPHTPSTRSLSTTPSLRGCRVREKVVGDWKGNTGWLVPCSPWGWDGSPIPPQPWTPFSLSPFLPFSFLPFSDGGRIFRGRVVPEILDRNPSWMEHLPIDTTSMGHHNRRRGKRRSIAHGDNPKDRRRDPSAAEPNQTKRSTRRRVGKRKEKKQTRCRRVVVVHSEIRAGRRERRRNQTKTDRKSTERTRSKPTLHSTTFGTRRASREKKEISLFPSVLRQKQQNKLPKQGYERRSRQLPPEKEPCESTREIYALEGKSRRNVAKTKGKGTEGEQRRLSTKNPRCTAPVLSTESTQRTLQEKCLNTTKQASSRKANTSSAGGIMCLRGRDEKGGIDEVQDHLWVRRNTQNGSSRPWEAFVRSRLRSVPDNIRWVVGIVAISTWE